MPVELFANNPSTTLNGIITNVATTIVVTSAALFPVAVAGVSQFRVIIESEILIVTNTAGLTWTVVRGAEGTTAAGHATGVAVVHIITAGGMTSGPEFREVCFYYAGYNFYAPGFARTGRLNVYTAAANQLYAFGPYPILDSGLFINAVSAQVSTAATAGATIRIGVIQIDGRTFAPKVLLTESAAMAADTTGQKRQTITPVALTQGSYVTVTVQCSAATGFEGSNMIPHNAMGDHRFYTVPNGKTLTRTYAALVPGSLPDLVAAGPYFDTNGFDSNHFAYMEVSR